MAVCSRSLRYALRVERSFAASILPFLYPRLVSDTTTHGFLTTRLQQKCRLYTSGRLHSEASHLSVPDNEHHTPLLELPTNCPGCGAFTQNIDPDAAGFYSAARKSVKLFYNQEKPFRTQKNEDETRIFQAALANADEDVLKSLGLDPGLISAGG